MDLVQTVRKEGSRGGVNFSWDDVKSSEHRENYLGHSLMAPVGRWQKGKDLGWYAKADDAELTPDERAERERERRRDEIKKIKEAEEDAMARALGLPVPDRSNANNEPLGEGRISQKEVNKALKEALDENDEPARDRDGHRKARHSRTGEPTQKSSHRRAAHDGRRERSRSRDRERDRQEGERSGRRHRRSRSVSRHRDQYRRQRHHHRSQSRSRSRDKGGYDARGRRDRSPRRSRKDHLKGSWSRSPRRRQHHSKSRSRSPRRNRPSSRHRY